MQHFFAGYYLEDLRDPQAYARVMGEVYGQAGQIVAERSVSTGRVWEHTDVEQFPLFEPAIQGAEGVIVHSEFFRTHVERAFAGPVRKIFLPYEISDEPMPDCRSHFGVGPDRVLLASAGHVNSNKRIHMVIRALALDPTLRERATYLVAGPCEPAYEKELRQAIADGGLEETVRLLGYISDERLRALLASADVCVTLRSPAFEGASASVIEQMFYGKPVIVTNTGFFAELPEECVRKVAPAREGDDLLAHLRGLVLDEQLRRRVGEAGRRFALENCRAEQYAREFLRFAWEVRSARPLLRFADRLGAELRRLGVMREMPIVDHVAEECHRLFCGAGSESAAGDNPQP
jgi:glycosyltransferase involved in cell wall biosynthesis